MNMADKIAELAQHGYKIRYADPMEAYEYGRVRWSQVTDYPYSEFDRPFIEFKDAVSPDNAGYGGSYWQQSNFRSLERDYGLALVRVGYANADSLGMFVHSASDELIELACRITDSAIYDESDWSDLEQEEIGNSFSSWLHSDLYRELPEWAQEIDHEFSDSEIEEEFWDVFGRQEERYEALEAADGEIRADYKVCGAVLVEALRNLKRRAIGRVSV